MPIKSIEDTQLLQEDINAIAKWALSWLMKFNIPKCCCLRFTEAKIHRVDSTYHLYDTSLSLSDHCKYLGVILQLNLNGIDILKKQLLVPILFWDSYGGTSKSPQHM